MADSPTSPPATPPPSIMPMLYYSLIIIATVAGLLALYNLIIIKCGGADRIQGGSSGGRILSRRSISSFKYKSDGPGIDDSECAVCLSAFEDGEELKRLPNCNHAFHAPCIDMWLYSHANCPICRATIAPPQRSAAAAAATAGEHRGEILLGPVVLV